MSNILPLPCNVEITPVETQPSHPGNSYFFTIPMKHMRPSPSTLCDIADSQIARQHITILMVLFYIIVKNFKDEDDVFMEYILSDPNETALIDCLGIRFHIYTRSMESDLLKGLSDVICENGGTFTAGEEVFESDAPEDERPKKKQKTANKKKPQRRGPTPIYHWWEDVVSYGIWMRFCSSYTGNELPLNDRGDISVAPSQSDSDHPENIFSWENSLLHGMLDEQKEEGIFGVPSAVWRIASPLRRNTMAIMAATLPGTPLWYQQSVDEMRDTYYKFMNEKALLCFFSDKSTKRNDLQELCVVQTDKVKRLEAGGATPEELQDFRHKSIRYISRVWSPSAAVSDPIKIMAKWAKDNRKWTSPIEPLLVDGEMSFFGNMVARDLLHFEQDLRISTTHTTLYRIMINALDAYRYAMDLHNNVVMLGGGATGKSHILDTLRDIFIPGTVTKVSHTTEKANAVGSDNNDHISVYHEMPPGLLGQDKSGAETGNHIIKDMMTSCEVITTSIHVDNEKGTREATKFVSQCVGVILSCTNERRDRMPDPVNTRMIKANVNEYKRKKFGIQQMTSKVSGITGGSFENPKSEKKFIRQWRMRQMLVNMVEKMIYCKNLVDVDMTIFTIMQLKMTEYMAEHDIIYGGGNIRDIKFLKHFARTMTIVHAVEWFVNHPQSPGYNQDISFRTLLQIQPLLFCNEEIALFTMSLNYEQLIFTTHFMTIEVLLYALKDQVVVTTGGEIESHQGYITSKPVYRHEGDVYRDLIKAQKSGNFSEKLSAENLKVAFNELRNETFQGVPILELSPRTEQILVNAGYIKKHFRWDNDLGRFKCKFDVNSVVQDVFQRSYCNKHTRTQKRMILGTVPDKDVPYLFTTVDKVPNPDREMVHELAISTNESGIGFEEETEAYTREGSAVTFNVDVQEYMYKQYLQKTNCQGDLQTIISQPWETNNKVYPTDYMEWYYRFNNI